jgi:deoxyxylulose-5-phosphate synthase
MDARFAVPLDRGAILGAARQGGVVITAEEGVVAGGFGLISARTPAVCK